MQLGNFSISLSVKDISVSKEFYESLGFTIFHGDCDQHWLIMKNGDATIGLFQGMFEKNILTFNPGWDANANPVDSYTDVRELQKRFKEMGVNLNTEVDPKTKGPASISFLDPDGNPILIDQHI